jgi:hypothetical protein
MANLTERYYSSSQPFTVHVDYGDGLAPDADFPAVQIDEEEYAWSQVQFSQATITAVDEDGNPVEAEE